LFSSEHRLRHLPFFQEISRHEESDAAWRNATAGLLVLRLIDGWIEDGAHVIQDEWTMRGVRSAIEEADLANNLRAILTNVVDSLAQAQRPGINLVAPRLMAYGQLLEYESSWDLAADVYETVVAHADPVSEADAATHAHLRRGFCLRHLGDLNASVAAYQAASQIAEAASDMEGVLRARIGESKAALARGNLPHADSILEDTAVRARAHNLSDVHSMALHDRAMIAGMREEYELSIKIAYEALELSQSARQRDRILSDIALSFHRLGVRSAARDAWLILAATGQEQYQRWQSTLNLMELSAEEGDEMMFEHYRRAVDESRLPPVLEINFWMQGGLGRSHLGQHELATQHLQRAIELAERYELHQMAFEAEAELKGVGTRKRLATREASALDPEIQRVAGRISATREELSV
jgi:tetratricopeptide (TPR) repeat protein